MITLLIVDDHALVRSGLRLLLEDIESFKVLGEAESAEEAINLCQELSPDVVLMDLSMPGMSGLEATPKLLRSSPDTKVLIITASDDLFSLEQLMQVGASGYLTKSTPREEMIRAIRIVHSGQRYIDSKLSSLLAVKSVNKKPSLKWKSPPKERFAMLSERELQIAVSIANGTKVSMLAETLGISPKTVNSYRYRVFDKLGVRTDVELTRLAIRHGLLTIHNTQQDT
jgi:two-component system invasion response regulator UvrY